MEKQLRMLLPRGKFINVAASRSRSMSCVRGKNNRTTELTLRMAFVRSGFAGWSLHSALVGKPDFYFVRSKTAIFVDGCFWHGCKKCGHTPKTRSKYWSAKLQGNQRRDRRVNRKLRKQGIHVIRIWEHQLARPDQVSKVLKQIQHNFTTSVATNIAATQHYP